MSYVWPTPDVELAHVLRSLTSELSLMGMIYSAAIIGAGPAGCAAAIALARTGLKVLLIEANAFPRDRPGESLHPGTEAIFETLGVADAVNAAGFSRYAGHRVAWELNAPERMEYFGEDANGAWLGYQAWRPKLDEILLAAAIAQGVDVWQPCRVRAALIEDRQLMGLKTDRGTVRAYYFLDASGQCQWLSRQLCLSSTMYSPKLLARFGYVACPKAAELFDIPLIRREVDGWSWIARITEDRCAWSRMRLSEPMLSNLCIHQDWRPPELDGFEPIGKTKSADVTWRMSDRPAGPGWFLLGDAAAVLDPAASHGVLRSLMCGMQAANVIAACERGEIAEAIAEQSYAQWLHTWFDKDVERLSELYQSDSTGWGAQFQSWPRVNLAPDGRRADLSRHHCLSNSSPESYAFELMADSIASAQRLTHLNNQPPISTLLN